MGFFSKLFNAKDEAPNSAEESGEAPALTASGDAPKVDEATAPAVVEPAAAAKTETRATPRAGLVDRSSVRRADPPPITAAKPPLPSARPLPNLKRPPSVTPRRSPTNPRASVPKKPPPPVPAAAPPRADSGTHSASSASPSEIFDKELDDLFDGVRQPTNEIALDGHLPTEAATQADIVRLFDQMAAMHLSQVRDFVLDLSCDQAGIGWLDVCRPALRTLGKGARDLGRTELATALDAFERTLADVAHAKPPTLSGHVRDRVLRAAEVLKKQLPEAFDFKGDRDRREPIIVHSLLEQVDGLGTTAIARFLASGLHTLRAFEQAGAADLAAIGGIDRRTADAVVETFERYRRQRRHHVPDALRNKEFARLQELAKALSNCQLAFERADADDDKAARRNLRRERARIVGEIDIMLAHLGELELIESLRRMSVERKLERVSVFLRKTMAAKAAFH